MERFLLPCPAFTPAQKGCSKTRVSEQGACSAGLALHNVKRRE